MKRNAGLLIVAFVLIAAAGCPGKTPAGKTDQTSGGTTQAGYTPGDWSSMSIEGAGASFPAPIYMRWAYSFEELTQLKLNYQSVGSGAGIAAIEAGTVDFGASDAPLEKSELDQKGLVQFPMVIGGVVPVVNIPGIAPGQLKLRGDQLASVYLGRIANWNDPSIAELNPGITLPDLPIVPAYRADGSGTSWIFTSYLDKISPMWHTQVGAGKSVQWPEGMGGKGNEGVSSVVQQVPGSIGYVEYAYAEQGKLAFVQLQNQSGVFVSPSIETFQAAASNADWAGASGFNVLLVDQPGDQSWPITGASFIIIRKDQADKNKARAMLQFFDWCFRYGQDAAKELSYVPVPLSTVDLIESNWEDLVSGTWK